MTTDTAELARIRTEIKTTFEGNIARLEGELAANKPGFIHVWPKYSLGVRIDETGKPQVVCVSLATIVPHNDPRAFFNGANLKASIVDRILAIESALASARISYANLIAELAKSDAKEA